MNIKRIFRGVLTTVSLLIIVTMTMLLCVVGCDNKDYSNASPFDNVVYLDAAQLKDVSNFTFNRTIKTGKRRFPLCWHVPQVRISMSVSK